MTTQINYNLTQQEEFAAKLLELQNEAQRSLSPMGWFLFTSALCSLGEPSRTIYPALSHSRTKIEGLGPTYKAAYGILPNEQREAIQRFYSQFVDSLSYGHPTPGDLRD
jgi:hypothetical protein